MAIWVYPKLRRRGLGGRLLKAICAAADAQEIHLRLTAIKLHPDGLDNDQLAAWYKRHGFIFEDKTDPYMMIRRPAIAA